MRGLRPFSISLRLKAMVSTVIVLVSITAIIGFKVQSIAFDQALQAHQAQIDFTLRQLSSKYSAALSSDRPDDERRRAQGELTVAMNDVVGERGLVFVAAYDVNGGIVTYARSPGYVGQLYQDLLEYAKASDPEAFSTMESGRRLNLEAAPVVATIIRKMDQESGVERQHPKFGEILVGHTTEQMEADFALVQKKIWSWIAGIGLLAAALSWFAAHSIVRPVDDLIQGTQRVARGDYEHPVTVKSRDEFRLLADSFNYMSQELRSTLQQLDGQNRNLENIVRERTSKLREAYQELQTLDKMKDGFLSSISHEFRTPITSIKAFSEILTDDTANLDETQREFLGIIKKEADRLGNLVNDVLDLAKIEAGEMPFSFTQTSPAVPIKNAMDALRHRISERDIQLDLNPADELPDVIWDSAKITRIVHELLANAVRFSPHGGRVTLTVEATEEMVEYQVRDEGPGIPADALEEVFKKFRQMGETLTDKPTGTGLGLPICRQIAKRHGGTLHAEACEASPGALVILRLPLVPPEAWVESEPSLEESDAALT